MSSSGPRKTTTNEQLGSSGWFSRLGALGDQPRDSEDERLRHRFLIYMGVFMSGGGLVWGCLSSYFGLYLQATIPFGYTALTAVNLGYFRVSKNFARVRFFQIGMSLVLPFLFQWVMGGFYASGAVMLWSMLAIVGSLTFTGGRTIIKWLVLYSLLVIVSGFIDAEMSARYALETTDGTRVLFFVVNIVLISNIVFGLTIYLIAQRERAERALLSANEQIEGLEQEVASARRLGQYTLEAKLGEGGMGEVYRASHAMLRRPTAIKLLPTEKVGEQSIKRFEQEVQLTAQLTHPNTITVFDYGRTPDGVFYYAMELLDGATVEDIVETAGPQSIARVIHVLRQTAAALSEAHAAGLMHRDIKPANLVLCKYGGKLDHVKVLDFGLVRSVARSNEAGITSDGMVAGTPAYLSPEALTNPDTVDQRSDLYAVGAVGFYLLAGENVFSGKTLAEVCGHHIHTAPRSPSDPRGEAIPSELERLILRCLEKDPAARPQTAGELVDLLADCTQVGTWAQEDARDWWDTSGAALRERSHADISTDRTIDVVLANRGPEHSHTVDVKRQTRR